MAYIGLQGVAPAICTNQATALLAACVVYQKSSFIIYVFS